MVTSPTSFSGSEANTAHCRIVSPRDSRFSTVDDGNLSDSVHRLQKLYADARARNEALWKSEKRTTALFNIVVFIDNALAGSISSAKELDALSALFDMYCNMIIEALDDLLSESPRYTLEGILIGLNGALRLCFRFDDAEALKKHMDKISGVWDKLWAHRVKLLEADTYYEDERMEHGVSYWLGRLISITTSLCEGRNCIPVWGKTQIQRLAFMCWFHQEPSIQEYQLYTTICSLSMCSHPSSVLHEFSRECVDEYGAGPFLARIYRDLEDEAVVDGDLQACVWTVATFGHPDFIVRAIGAQAELVRHVITALRRQQKLRSLECEARMWLMAMPMIAYFLSDEDIRETVQPSVLEDHVGTLLSRGIILLPHGPKPQHAHNCAEVVRQYETFVKIDLHDGVSKGHRRRIYVTLRRDVRTGWYPALQALRAMVQAESIPNPDLTGVLDAWKALGEALSLSAAYERSHSFCAWKECEFSTTSAPHRMQRCRQCKKVCYCDRVCQRRDWKEGGHKDSCISRREQKMRSLKAGPRRR